VGRHRAEQLATEPSRVGGQTWMRGLALVHTHVPAGSLLVTRVGGGYEFSAGRGSIPSHQLLHQEDERAGQDEVEGQRPHAV
jgi:hypothetical protein